MPAYMIVKVNVTDMEQYQEYMKATPSILEQFGGRFIARGGETVTLEGPEEAGRVVLVEFPSLETAVAFYNSADYQAAIKLREGAATASFIVVDGVQPAPGVTR
ncbi:MAG: DUF1330 domain-containing protein [Anaerolineae bacterium]|nr:DUF1330 domain-containing protein [Anaerolineae bacterium]